MPIEGVQNYNITSRNGAFSNVVAGGVLGVAGGYAAKHLLPLDAKERSGIPYEYLTGKTKDRQKAVENFNNNPNIPIFLISLKAGGTGLNLTGADYVIHYDPWWNPAVEDQATDRAYRIGQTKKVFVYRLITKNTVEEKIQKIKGRKRDLVDSVVSIDRNIAKSLTMEDIKDIFSVD